MHDYEKYIYYFPRRAFSSKENCVEIQVVHICAQFFSRRKVISLSMLRISYLLNMKICPATNLYWMSSSTPNLKNINCVRQYPHYAYYSDKPTLPLRAET